MTTSTLTLTDFLLARIGEDEDVVRAIRPHEYLSYRDGRELTTADRGGYAAIAIPSGRVLAECEAKRRIVEMHPIYRGDRIQPIDTSGTDFGCELCHRLDALHSDSLIEAVGYCDTLLALALPYADHPDYDESWRP